MRISVEKANILQYVGLSMICYTMGEKEISIFLGEDQLSGRIGKLL